MIGPAHRFQDQPTNPQAFILNIPKKGAVKVKAGPQISFICSSSLEYRLINLSKKEGDLNNQ